MITREFVLAVAFVGTVASVQAATIDYTYTTSLPLTNQSWSNGPFANVKIDEWSDGLIEFTVTLAGDAVGQNIEQFGFSAYGAIDLTTATLTLPTNWSLNSSANMDGFGTFEWAVEKGSGAVGQNPLVFSIDGIAGDTAATYASLGSTGGQPNSGVIFSAKLSSTGPGAFIGGGDQLLPPGYVPIPAAAWLFASALGIFGYLAKRKASG